MPKIHLLLVDDHAQTRRGLRIRFRATDDIEVCGEAASGREAAGLASRLHPDVVLMDVRMRDGNGIDGIRALRDYGLECPVILMTAFDINDYLISGMQAGARGFFLKTSTTHEVMRIVRAVAKGHTEIAPDLIDRASHFAPIDSVQRRDLLTAREIAVIRALCEGPTSTTTIADRLEIETETIKGYLKKIYATVGVSSRAELVAWAFRSGVV